MDLDTKALAKHTAALPTVAQQCERRRLAAQDFQELMAALFLPRQLHGSSKRKGTHGMTLSLFC